ncbi:hypothetical protein I5Q34_34080 [Streptomyces sp. AV19]|uniref:hypothetical protein n=1 Tax=Streptomyces sp. AV19 TaxID=2793068 RepID=UPI0018FED3F5|nr:hypothetical protein [Streptomyces sp. AV19]MBH1939230.1 hypothetical protein [Streptomyces sp. AV19]MDG4537188.1 hypothetical protein [Streptomyces sp. AV19]
MSQTTDTVAAHMIAALAQHGIDPEGRCTGYPYHSLVIPLDDGAQVWVSDDEGRIHHRPADHTSWWVRLYRDPEDTSTWHDLYVSADHDFGRATRETAAAVAHYVRYLNGTLEPCAACQGGGCAECDDHGTYLPPYAA